MTAVGRCGGKQTPHPYSRLPMPEQAKSRGHILHCRIAKNNRRATDMTVNGPERRLNRAAIKANTLKTC